jgi:hypothetical protein
LLRTKLFQLQRALIASGTFPGHAEVEHPPGRSGPRGAAAAGLEPNHTSRPRVRPVPKIAW